MEPWSFAVALHHATVAASAVIAVLTMYVAFELAGRIYRAADVGTARLWMWTGSLAMGSGIWATHFVGMSAAAYPFRATYEIALTLASWIVAVPTAAIFLAVAAHKEMSRARFALLSLLAGFGAVAMHLIGTEAMALRPAATYDVAMFAIAVVVMCGGTSIALRLFIAHRDLEGAPRLRRQLAAAATYGGALAVMHYLGMASMNFAANTICTSTSGLDVSMVGNAVGFAAIIFLVVVLTMTTLEQQAHARARRLNGSLAMVRKELRFVTFNDSVTGLPNRLVFQDRLKQAIARCDRSSASLAILFVDLDNATSKRSMPAAQDDDTLKRVATALVDAARGSDTVANVGGDQFLVILEGLDGAQTAVRIAERFATNIGELTQGASARVTASIGISLYPTDGSADELVRNASAAAASLKRRGGDGYCFFEAKMNREAEVRAEWLEDLRRAPERGELELYYQPKIHTGSGHVSGYEALLRWHHPTRGLVSPAIFIPLAEQFGLIDALGRWVIAEACRQMQSWQQLDAPMRVAINISVCQLRRPGLAQEIADALERSAVAPSMLICEITESDAMDDSTAMLEALERLRAIGVQLSIDDFGTGYSSLSYLRRLPVRQLKIDQSFVRDLESSEDARSIVEAIINLAHVLRLEVVAEGVETSAQQQVLQRLGCDELQGYLFGHPVPARDLATAPVRSRERPTGDPFEALMLPRELSAAG